MPTKRQRKTCRVIAYERKRYKPNKGKLEYCPEDNRFDRLKMRCYDTKAQADAVCRAVNGKSIE
jgi:hypothetical protein